MWRSDIRISVVIGALEVGGAEMHLAQVLPALVAQGFEVVVHTLTGRGALADRIEVGGARVLAPAADGSRAGGFAGRVMRAARAGIRLARDLRSVRPDVVHFFLPEAYLVGAPVARLAVPAARRVLSRRSLNDYQAKRPLLARMERALHPWMHAVVGNSSAVVAELATEGVQPDRLHLIRNGIDFARFDRVRSRIAVRSELGMGAGTVAIVCVANLIPYKGHADLIGAFAQVAAGGRDAVLLLAGRDDGIGGQLMAQAAASGVGEKVRFLGSRDDVPDLLSAADIAVLPSHEEGLPNAVIEAMAARLPVVATRVGGIPDLVEDGASGLLVPPRDPESLARSLTKAIDDAGWRAAAGRAGRSRAEAEFSLVGCVSRYAALYRAVVKD